jgi:hypothetical protein
VHTKYDLRVLEFANHIERRVRVLRQRMGSNGGHHRASTNNGSYQLKFFALLFSSFEEVLFLEADAFPVHDLNHLLRVEPFISTGLVT